MRVYVIIASINELANVKAFENSLVAHDCKVIIVDEGDKKLRKKNNALLRGIPHLHYGPYERTEWFKQRFGSNYKEYLSVIPRRCHAETSFGFLVAYEEFPDLVIELDDDVFPVQGYNLVDDHSDNLFNGSGICVRSNRKWYNSIENLELGVNARFFPRGHPYGHEARAEEYLWSDEGSDCILNMGLWLGHPDLDALTILYHGGLDGKCSIEATKCKRKKVIVGEGVYSALCSMNTSLIPEIIPAFYQLYMNFMGIDRFDDIWSGIFLKKIADHLEHKVCLGEPLIYHNKRPRDVFRDLESELGGMMINEILWIIVDALDIEGETYWDGYNSLVSGLEENTMKLPHSRHQKFVMKQIEKMRLWLTIIDKLK